MSHTLYYIHTILQYWMQDKKCIVIIGILNTFTQQAKTMGYVI